MRDTWIIKSPPLLAATAALFFLFFPAPFLYYLDVLVRNLGFLRITIFEFYRIFLGPGVEPRLPVAACAAAGFNPMSKEEPALLLVVISVASVAASWRARGADPQHNFASSMYTASAPADVIAREIKSGTRFDSSGSGQVARCQVRGGLGTFGGNGGNCGPWGEAGGKWSV